MKTTALLTAAAMLGLAAGGPAYAQMQSGSMAKDNSSMMSSDKGMKMSMADKKMMTKCNGMSHAAMMKNKGCMKMMKMHPDMMKSS